MFFTVKRFEAYKGKGAKLTDEACLVCTQPNWEPCSPPNMLLRTKNGPLNGKIVTFTLKSKNAQLRQVICSHYSCVFSHYSPGAASVVQLKNFQCTVPFRTDDPKSGVANLWLFAPFKK